jgi:kumamolisin
MNAQQQVALPDSERVPLPGFRAVRPANQAARLTVSVYLRENPDAPTPPDVEAEALKPLAERVYLSKQELAHYFGPAPADVAAVVAFAKAHDLTVGEENPAASSIKLTGTVKAIQTAFGVSLNHYENDEQASYRGREGAIHVPAELAGIVEGVFGLDNRRIGRGYRRTDHTTRAFGEANQALLNLPPNTYLPPTVGKLYDFPEQFDGTGQTIGILAFNNVDEGNGVRSAGGYKPELINAYFNRVLHLAPPDITDVVVHGPGNDPGDGSDGNDSSGEVYLDLCMAGALAPGAKIVMYFTEFTEQGWVDAVHAAVSDTASNLNVLSVSYGNPERDPGRSAWTGAAVRRVNRAFQIAAATGLTICCASGDDGSADEPDTTAPHADFPASSPWVLGCGGTRLEASGTAISSEKVWNDLHAGHGATGGGVSTVFAKPTWQQSVTVPTLASGKSGRGVPDVAALADPETPLAVLSPDGSVGGVGGTSAAAPLWAALITRLNQGLGHPVGFLNPALYTKLAPGVLRDITEGNNGSYTAGQGWDACSGFGAPGGVALLTALQNL